MHGLLEDAGRSRRSSVGVMADGQVIHMAPQADRVDYLMNHLLSWLQHTEQPPLYEFEFIHPFTDGNGHMGCCCNP